MQQWSQMGEGPFVCPECGKVVTHKANVTLHQKIHAREKSYVCSECEQDFAHRPNTKRATLEKSPINSGTVENRLLGRQGLGPIRSLVWVRDVMNAVNVERRSFRSQHFIHPRGTTRKKSPMFAWSVGRHSSTNHILLYTGKFVPGRNRTSVAIVGNPSL